MAIQQAVELADLRVRLAEETLARTRCQNNRRREGAFLEAVINQCKGDNVPLTEPTCSDFCRRNQVLLPVCKALCQIKVPSCSYWHQDTHKAPITTFEEIHNRSRREEGRADVWLTRLQTYRELRRERDTEAVAVGNHVNVEEETQDSKVEEEKKDSKAEEGEVVWEDSGIQTLRVIEASNATMCHHLSCVNHEAMDTVACLDLNLLDKSAGYFRLNSGCRV